MTRELTEEEMKEVLATQALGQLACCRENQPYIVPMGFSYKAGILYGQTVEGKKTDILRENPACCFHVGDTKGSTWRSVLCEGVFEELDFSSITEPEVLEAITQLSQRLKAIQDVVGIDVPMDRKEDIKPLTKDGKQSTLFRIVITKMTGRGGHGE